MAYEEALEAAGAKIIAFNEFGSYQGDWWAKVRYNDKIGWVHGYYGSCSFCDAFEGEFGYKDDKCAEHRWSSESHDDCHLCKVASVDYQNRLVDFGKEYLDDIKNQSEAEACASENIEWDSDAAEMLVWLKANAL